MTSTPDLVIRGGNIADGKGGDLYRGRCRHHGGRITEVGKVLGKGKEEIDAKGKLVAPGFVDVHTHYDGQVTWSQDITPSVAERRHHGDHGQLRRRLRAMPAGDHVRLIQ
jgi:N-acyl-D-aspartate/D-glutamate deacylase